MPAPGRSATNGDHLHPSPDRRGQVLVAIPRGETDELRVTLDEYSGRAYLMLQVWEQGRDGRRYPVRGKGCSVRVRELGQVIAALEKAAKPTGQGRQPRQGKGVSRNDTLPPDDRPVLPGLGGPVDETPDDDVPF